jgi:hypothetical protein
MRPDYVSDIKKTENTYSIFHLFVYSKTCCFTTILVLAVFLSTILFGLSVSRIPTNSPHSPLVHSLMYTNPGRSVFRIVWYLLYWACILVLESAGTYCWDVGDRKFRSPMEIVVIVCGRVVTLDVHCWSGNETDALVVLVPGLSRHPHRSPSSLPHYGWS